MQNSSYMRCEHVVACDLDGGKALLDLQKSQYYKLNGTASHIWEAMDEPRTLNDLVDVIMDMFDVDRSRCENDVSSILSAFESAGMIETHDIADA